MKKLPLVASALLAFAVTACEGPQGPEGPAGPAGADGADGTDGTNGMDGADGTDGTDGMDGMDGADGAPGGVDSARFTGTHTTHALMAMGDSGVSGWVRIAELQNPTATLVSVQLDEPTGGVHPAHIHAGNFADGGSVSISLGNLDGATGALHMEVTENDAATAVSYADITGGDFYVAVHDNGTDLNVVGVADIGDNALTGESETYMLMPAGGADTGGWITLHERVSGATLVEVWMSGGTAGDSHLTHIHANTAAESGGPVVTTNNVDGDTGWAWTHVAETDAAAAITYTDLTTGDYYFNVHQNSDGGGAIAQADIGENALTGTYETYDLFENAGSGVGGWVRVHERASGAALIEVRATNTTAGDTHVTHVHADNFADGGAAVITTTPVDGDTGVSWSHVEEDNNSNAITYTDLTTGDYYFNVHTDSAGGGGAVASADMGENALTGEMVEYRVTEAGGSGVDGFIRFHERNNGFSLVEVRVSGTASGTDHQTHLHADSWLETGAAIVNLANVDGATGVAYSNVEEDTGASALTYADLVELDGYFNVHATDTGGAAIANADVGINALTGRTINYALAGQAFAPNGASGALLAFERVSGAMIVVLDVTDGSAGNSHAVHIHEGVAGSGGNAIITLGDLDGTSGISVTHVEETDVSQPFTFEDLLTADAYVNVHDPTVGANIWYNGNLGQNVWTGDSDTFVVEAVDGSGVSGFATIYERNNGGAVIKLELTGTTAGGSHPAHVHNGDGSVAITLSDVDGDTGVSWSPAHVTDGGQFVGYWQLVGFFDGYINVHNSWDDLTVLATGDIGTLGL